MRLGKSLLQRSAMRKPTSKPGGGGGEGGVQDMVDREVLSVLITDFFEDTLIGP